MRDVETLKGLLERVQSAGAEHSPVLDAHAICTLIAPPEAFVSLGPISGAPRICIGKMRDGRDKVWEPWLEWRLTHPTVSVDAALLLTEHALPGACTEVTLNASKDGRRISTAFIRLGDHDIGECWEAATAPLAICAALLSALLAQAEAPSTSAGGKDA
ncbi:hypothetical protein [Methylorubrum extorquens]|uniref:hypothetical protein n=1 Tax=Methylorubrum extorquens TaxID=408 RepID=UPI0022376D66|nr:hypothetical protein [Methylorubrum extorquens]UYW32463.1 hypothetical protein OKB92_26455 [Methylorubrum extorquens]